MDYEGLLKEYNYLNIREKKLKAHEGLCLGDRVAINKDIETNKEKNCVLAEEIGHYNTTHGNILDLTDIRNRKQEKKARNWAYEKLVGIVSLVNAFEKGVRTRSELAEYLNVTEEFLEKAIQHYREKYGIYYQIDNYTVYFEPNLMVLKIF